MSEEALLAVNVWLAGRSYRIRVRKEDEAVVRKAVKAADAQVSELRQHFAGKDDQDFVAMCLLMYATEGALGGNAPETGAALKALTAKIAAVIDQP